ncbi:hypothetical protein EV202_11535 [Bacteroides heparinolyticus]|uniref:DUF438 domain-containing protein n=1 Tax=Prevotella heparinolytica TaxID=28113 RepID=A0A4R2LQY1_9BACE|nr:DUF438 domain-containing protein [Bacteroides heparinolyticus]TCO90755.1 hypothetical protein EV202_11535 [Bacteroides heparinolyticus]
MSEIINNSAQRKEMLRHLLLRLHEGENPEALRNRLIEVLKTIPYNEVVEVEQTLINEQLLSEAEIQDFCDLHTAVLDGSIDLGGAKAIPAGHPADTFRKENEALKAEIAGYEKLTGAMDTWDDAHLTGYLLGLRTIFNSLADVDKHYKRKEYLLFPFLEKHLITGPPKVMWGKHDETRLQLKKAFETLTSPLTTVNELKTAVATVCNPAVEMIAGMIKKEEEILFPMSMDTLTEDEWYKIYQETPDFGYCLIDTDDEWAPASTAKAEKQTYITADAIRLSSGAFSVEELEALFIHLPIDITFVDKDDKVRFFSHSPKRVFERNRSIIGRDVRMCHPPGSVHVVEKILEDFKSGKENKAAFWISNFKNRFVYIEYSAVRGKNGEYLGVVEVTQDITGLRALEGDRRLLSYEK